MKPCPFCGSEVRLWDAGFGIVRVVECEKCQCRFVFAFSAAENPHELQNAWNRRCKT